MKHVNAADVLPPELLREVQRHCPGGYIYVPVSEDVWRSRRDEILRLRRLGIGTAGIAGRVHLCTRRVQQILREAVLDPPE